MQEKNLQNIKRSGQMRLGFEQNRTMIKNYFLIHRLVVLTNSIVEFVHLDCFPNFVESWAYAQLALFAEIGIPISLCWVPSADNPAFGTPLIGFPEAQKRYVSSSNWTLMIILLIRLLYQQLVYFLINKRLTLLLKHIMSTAIKNERTTPVRPNKLLITN